MTAWLHAGLHHGIRHMPPMHRCKLVLGNDTLVGLALHARPAGIPVKMQKLMFKGSAVKDDDSTLRQVSEALRAARAVGAEGRREGTKGRVGVREARRTALDLLASAPHAAQRFHRRAHACAKHAAAVLPFRRDAMQRMPWQPGMRGCTAGGLIVAV